LRKHKNISPWLDRFAGLFLVLLGIQILIDWSFTSFLLNLIY
jgi:threonine/homoserine/homoserine lactone efflux protein